MIEIRGLSKSFERPDEGRIDVLKNIDFDVDDGDFVAIVGPSGSGKSTLMNILGLLSRPDSGDYLLSGNNVSGLPAKQLAGLRNRTIGFVFQQFHLLSRTTSCENVELPLLYSDVPDAKQKAIEALCKVGLEDRLTHYPSELSGGQQQRVAIARALVNQPDIILADEPTGNLDNDSAEQIISIFKALNRAGTTILFITHDTELAKQASRVVRIDNGKLETTATFSNPQRSAQGNNHEFQVGAA
jgi:ABC-type lipoprotein export system ATPase subunit